MQCPILSRLHRIIWQLQGIERMLEQKDSCEKVTIQFQAAKSALDKAFCEFLYTHIDVCLQQTTDKKKMKKLLDIMTKQT